MKIRLPNILLSPWAVFAGITAGILIGIYNKGLADKTAPLGEIYLALLQMCVIPILITAVLSSLGKLLMSHNAAKYVSRIVLVFMAGLLMSSILGVATGYILKPGGNLDKASQITLGRTIIEAESSVEQNPGSKSSVIMNFMRQMVTGNVVAAITEGNNLTVLLFFALLGIAIGVVRSPGRETLLESINVFYDALLEIIKWVMYLLPFGLCFLVATQVSQIGLSMFSALLKLVLTCYLTALILILIYGMVIWSRTGGSYFKSFIELKEAFIIAFGTSSSFAAIPAALKGLQNNLHIDNQSNKLVIPLGVNLNPQGSVMHFAVSTLFIAQLYHVKPDISFFLIVIIGVILAGLAATGVPGAGSLVVLGMVLEPLGLPVATAIILLTAIDPILDPVITTVNIHASCAAAALVGTKEGS